MGPQGDQNEIFALFCSINDRFYKGFAPKNPGALRAPQTFILLMVYGCFFDDLATFRRKSHFATPVRVLGCFQCPSEPGRAGRGQAVSDFLTTARC